MTLRTLTYGNYGIFLLMGNAGFISSTAGFPLTWNGSDSAPGWSSFPSWEAFGFRRPGARRFEGSPSLGGWQVEVANGLGFRGLGVLGSRI